jgi:adenosylcobinamide kinase/adenosylcobinamide-phosphate guanylyltransferase
MDVDVDTLCAVLVRRSGDTVLVSDEVGLGVHPSSPSGLRFRDALGVVNQAVASVADRTLLVVAGQVLALGPVPVD